MLNYRAKEIVHWIHSRIWYGSSRYDRIGRIYDYVQNRILLGSNKSDGLTATQNLSDGMDQCNTKAALIMALIRGVGIPCRLHGYMP